MRRYETIFLTPTTVGEESVQNLVERIKALIARSDGELLDVQKWGERNLAYEIKKNRRGRYFRLDFVAETNLTELIQKIEETFRFSEDVLRYMTIKIDNDITLEEAKKKIGEEDVPVGFSIPSESPSSEDSDKPDKKDESEPATEEPAKDEETESDEAPASEDAAPPAQ